jgi:hypothetical protein
MTVYTSFDFETMAANRGVLGSSNLVQVLFHQETIRGDWTPESSGLSEHPLRIGETADDWFEDDGERIIESGHKFGGRPYLTRPNPTLEEQIRLIEDGGFVHVLQIDFPGGGEDAIVDGDWPFGTGMFHVFAQPPFNNPRCYWLWEW